MYNPDVHHPDEFAQSSAAVATLAPPALDALSVLEAARSPDRRLDERQLIVASNRGPVRYRLRGDRIEALPAAGGLASALSGLAGQVPLTWIATPDGPAERLIAGRSASDPSKPGAPRLRFVLASKEALNWSYRRFSNPVLWFLQHELWRELRRPDLPAMIERGWTLGYRPVNEAFARAIAGELRGTLAPIVQVHDYHLYLVPGLLRRYAPGALVHHFTHIPWPGPEQWQPLPSYLRREICLGLLGADMVGFQTATSATNFLRCCQEFVPGAGVDHDGRRVWLDGRLVRVRAHPISVDPVALRRLAASAETLGHRERLRHVRGERTIVRVDRLDPSKNVALGFRAFGLLLERRPDLVGRVRFLAFLVPSRETIAEYRRHAQEVWREVAAVNARFARGGWKPIKVFYEDNRAQAIAGLALSDVVLVNAVADGMNLVAKEGMIVGERNPVLVLSEGCGAHEQLCVGALSIPPRDVDATAAALERALEMPGAERLRRAERLRAAIEAEDLSWWLRRQMDDLLVA